MRVAKAVPSLDLESTLTELKLKVNETKTKFMVQTKTNGAKQQPMTTREYSLESADNFIYPGAQLRKDGKKLDE